MQAAIQYASKLRHEEIVRLLVEHGADVNGRTGGTGSAVQLASGGGHLSIVKFLVEHGANVKSPPGRCGSAIQRASCGGHLSVVKFLLEHGANVNGPVGRDGSAIARASGRGHLFVAKFLLEHGADPNLEDPTALCSASFAGQKEMIELLLDNGATINTPGRDGTALIAASLKGFKGIVKFLLENGADIDIQDERRGTALQAASQNWKDAKVCGRPHAEYTEILHLLVEMGANTQIALRMAARAPPGVREEMSRLLGA
ncbi:ankyrin repeat-containing domain protein [Ilyonectria destructans]|nr:ankyrin repeat-containing domain protein [Ilyonectria destructans]